MNLSRRRELNSEFYEKHESYINKTFIRINVERIDSNQIIISFYYETTHDFDSIEARDYLNTLDAKFELEK